MIRDAREHNEAVTPNDFKSNDYGQRCQSISTKAATSCLTDFRKV